MTILCALMKTIFSLFCNFFTSIISPIKKCKNISFNTIKEILIIIIIVLSLTLFLILVLFVPFFNTVLGLKYFKDNNGDILSKNMTIPNILISDTICFIFLGYMFFIGKVTISNIIPIMISSSLMSCCFLIPMTLVIIPAFMFIKNAFVEKYKFYYQVCKKQGDKV